MVLSVFKTYRSSLILLLAILIGGIAGYAIGPDVAVVKPFGDLFLNLMFMIIVPLVFFSVASAIANMNEMKRLGKIMLGIAVVFVATAAVSAVLGFLGASLYNPLHNVDTSAIKELMGDSENTAEKMTLLNQLVSTFTVPDFVQLFSKEHILQLIVFAVIFGIATTMAGEKGQPMAKFLTSGQEVSMKVVKIVMYYAPIGLGCYFAFLLGDFIGGDNFVNPVFSFCKPCNKHRCYCISRTV